MLDLGRLTVSLTKHGAHKIALLLANYDKDDILNRLWDKEPGINIEAAQAKKNLSVNSSGVVPDVWNKARAAGSESIDALVFIGIIFSHHQLIAAMRAGRTQSMRGRIQRGKGLNGKAFTNFAHTIEELGYRVSHNPDQVTYNLSKLFEIPGLNKLAIDLFKLKLRTAGWDGKTPIVDELIGSQLNEVFSITPEQFRHWLTTGDADAIGVSIQDEVFLLDTTYDVGVQAPFAFTPGHVPKKTGVVDIEPAMVGGKAELLHNELQTSLYQALVNIHGEACVGTEQSTGHGTSIDLVVKTGKGFWFYEIKVAKTLKAVIRQAVPQLLEYAFWRSDVVPLDKLIIVSRFRLTPDAAAYLEVLRKRCNLPIYYEQHSTDGV